MQDNLQPDDVDGRILTALGQDSRRSYADVAAEVGLSTAAVHEQAVGVADGDVVVHGEVADAAVAGGDGVGAHQQEAALVVVGVVVADGDVCGGVVDVEGIGVQIAQTAEYISTPISVTATDIRPNSRI